MKTNTMILQNSSYHQGLLFCAHLIMNVDGVIDERELTALQSIREEENIPHHEYSQFQETIRHKTEKEIYLEGLEFLNRCSEQERLRAMVHLFRLTESDETIHRKEVRFLLYSIKGTNVDFNEVEINARLVKARKTGQ